MNPFRNVHAFPVVEPFVMHFVHRSTPYKIEMVGGYFGEIQSFKLQLSMIETKRTYKLPCKKR